MSIDYQAWAQCQNATRYTPKMTNIAEMNNCFVDDIE